MLLSDIAHMLEGKLVGNNQEIFDVSTIEEAGPSDITFLANPKYKDKALITRAGAILVGQELETDTPQVVVDDPYLAFSQILEMLHPPKQHAPGVSSSACVHPDAEIDPSACIYPLVYVGAGSKISGKCVLYPGCFIGEGVTLGEETFLYPNVVIYDGCSLGKGCILHAGVVIGSDGFGFVWDGHKHKKIPQTGVVILGDFVEIGSNCTIDRAVLTSTLIGSDVKMDNQVQIGHNVRVGDHTIIVAMTGIAGSAQIGNNVILAGQVGVAGHIKVGDGCTVAARAGITSDLAPGRIVSGYPEMDHKHWLRVQKAYKDLPDLLKRIRELERRLDAIDKD